MALDLLKTVEVIEALENFVSKNRPPEHIRAQLDIGYKIDGQSVYIHTIRPKWSNPEIIEEYAYAKTTYVKANNHWKVFWMRADLKWHSYTPKPIVKTIEAFTKLVDEDKHHCFTG